MLNMKKSLLAVFAALSVFAFVGNVSGAEPQKEKVEAQYEINYRGIGSNLLWYIPNCLLDLADCFSIEFSAGDIGLGVNLTKYASFGAGVGNGYNVGWTNKRQIGFFNDMNYNADFLYFSAFEKNRRNLYGTYEDYFTSNFSNADIIKYPRSMRHEDPYAIGVKAAFLLGVKVQFHPVEFADFLCELFFFDLNNDSRKQPVVNVIE